MKNNSFKAGANIFKKPTYKSLEDFFYSLEKIFFYLYCERSEKTENDLNIHMEEKIKYELEFPVKASPTMLFPFLSTPSGLSEWFCNDVNSRGELFTFFWDDSEESAKMIKKKQDKFIMFSWMDDVEDGNKNYWEFNIVVDELTKDVSLMVTDYAPEDELEESKQLWDSQIHELLHVIGA